MAKGQVLFSSGEYRSLPEVIAFLRDIANRLEQQGSFTVAQAGRQFDIRPEGNIFLETKHKVKKHGTQKLEIELEWASGLSII